MVINIVKFIALVLITFFMCRIIANKRKSIAVLGTLLICFSTAVIEYIDSGLIEALLFGQAIVILINEFFKTEAKTKYLALIGIGLGIVGFLLLSNVTWQISIGTVLMALLIWIFIKNKDKLNKKNILLLVVFSIVAIVLSVMFYTYDVMECKENGQIIYYLTSYFYSYILPFNENAKFITHGALTCMISAFPMPLIIALVYMYKKEKHTEFILPMIGIAFVQIISTMMFEISRIIPNYIMAISISLSQIYLMVYFFANVKEEIFSLKGAAYVTLAYLVLVAIMPLPQAISARIILSFMALGTTLESFLICKYEYFKIQKIAPYIYGLITLIGFIGTICVKVLWFFVMNT